jgi:hypothetical protein
VPDHLDESNLLDYLTKIASVDPENVLVRFYAVDLYRERGDLDRARDTMDALLSSGVTIPEPFTKSVCNLYDVLNGGEAEPAEWIAANCR